MFLLVNNVAFLNYRHPESGRAFLVLGVLFLYRRVEVRDNEVVGVLDRGKKDIRGLKEENLLNKRNMLLF